METTTIKVTFAKRTEAQVQAKVATSHPDVPKVECTLDFGRLTDTEILQWAQRGVVISMQSKLDSGTITLDSLRDKVIEVPKPGDRKRLSDTDKIKKLVAGILGKDVKDITDAEMLAVLGKATAALSTEGEED